MLSSEAELLALREQWTALYRTNTNNTPYQSWEWNHTWWAHFGRPGELRLFVGEQDGQLLGIAPFCLSNRVRGWPIRHLTLISRKHGEYLDLIIRAGAEVAFCNALCEHLREHCRDVRFFELKDFRSGSSNFAPLLQAAANTFPVQSIESMEIFVTVPLTPSFESFVATLGKRFSKDVAYDRRFLARKFAVDFKIATDPKAPPGEGGLQDLIKVYRERWQEVKGETQFDRRETREFEQAICTMFAQAGMYRSYVLYVDKEPVAGLLGYVVNDKYFGSIYMHSPRFHKFSVGNVLLGMAIEDCIANQWTELDLTRGPEPYKFRWNGQARRNYHLKICHRRSDLALAACAEWLYELAASLQLAQRARNQFNRLKLQLRGGGGTAAEGQEKGSRTPTPESAQPAEPVDSAAAAQKPAVSGPKPQKSGQQRSAPQPSAKQQRGQQQSGQQQSGQSRPRKPPAETAPGEIPDARAPESASEASASEGHET
jgi:CelD/BcsL family acetyltransferase involved in cellulose biosynthesis